MKFHIFLDNNLTQDGGGKLVFKKWLLAAGHKVEFLLSISAKRRKKNQQYLVLFYNYSSEVQCWLKHSSDYFDSLSKIEPIGLYSKILTLALLLHYSMYQWHQNFQVNLEVLKYDILMQLITRSEVDRMVAVRLACMMTFWKWVT